MISTSISCTLQPFPATHDQRLLFSSSSQDSCSDYTANLIPDVSAHELRYFKQYRQDDYVIYRDWVGRVKAVYDEVTVRLTNGSVVVVKDPEQLEESSNFPSTDGHIFEQKLVQAGYNKYQTRRTLKNKYKEHTFLAQPCYPGQIVQTSKRNLLRGQWKFGEYNSSVPTKGIVVEVRCVQLEVSWTTPNVFKPFRTQVAAPSPLIDSDVLESGLVVVYDHNRLPRVPGTNALPGAAHNEDIGYGHRVRFRDPDAAALKYNRSHVSQDGQLVGKFEPIPSIAVQKYDMNVLQIVKTRSRVMVQWQDGSTSVEDANSLYPYLIVDDHELWPGDLVSLKNEELIEHDMLDILRTRAVGVVQTVDAIERVARIRWFDNTDTLIQNNDSSSLPFTISVGSISSRYNDVSLYEVAAHSRLSRERGDLAVVIPYPLPSPETIDIPGQNPAYQECIKHARNTLTYVHPDILPSDRSAIESSEGINWFGEIIDLLLDGQVTLRLGALTDPQDITLPMDRIMILVGDEDTDSQTSNEESGGYSDISDTMLTGTSFAKGDSREPIDIAIEYEGGRRLDEDFDESMWMTDDEDSPVLKTESSEIMKIDESKLNLEYTAGEPEKCDVLIPGDSRIIFSSYPTMPPRFSILDGPPPNLHHYYHDESRSSANLMRRIRKEHQIMQSSLPDGVFVRTWESRLDLLRILIVGPRHTPYELAPFIIDFHLREDFPTSPPDAFFYSWTQSIGRINPNLYENGKICLSLLGTWPADEKNEGWSAKGSSILQIIVSLMGLVLVEEPYYNEAGFDVLIGTEENRTASAQYTEKAFVMAKRFVASALELRSGLRLSGFEDILKWLYLPSGEGPNLLQLIIQESKALLPENLATGASLERQCPGSRASSLKLSSGALIILRRNLESLEQILRSEEGAASSIRPLQQC